MRDRRAGVRGTGSVGGAARVRRAAGADLAHFEALERRLLLSADLPVIDSVAADNRGLVVLEVSADLNASTVNQNSVKVFTAGQDGLLGTDDDVDTGARVAYSAAEDTITIDAESALDPDQRYQIFLDGSLIRGVGGHFLDGEFNVGGASGDGVQGGDFVAFASTAGDDALIARLTTSFGVIDVEMFRDETPLHVANFFRYADAGLYDGVFFNRSVEDFVIQGGGFEADPPDFEPIRDFPPVQNEPGISNLRGTLALAKLGGNPNSGTNEFFFNLGDNSANLDNQNGGFTVFGEITNAAGLAVVDAINDLATVDLSDIQSAFTDVPVTDPDAALEALTVDLLPVIERTAALMVLSDLPQNQVGDNLDTIDEVTNPNGAGLVRVINLDGNDPGNLSVYLDVQWGGDGEIRRLTLNDGFTGRIGVQVQDADVRFIDDRRTDDGRGELAFIVVDGEVQRTLIRQAITGFDLNGASLPGGLTFADDIDGDGRRSDATGIFVGSGLTANATFLSDVTSDVVYEGGVRSVVVRGDLRDTDVRVGNEGLSPEETDRTFTRLIVRGEAENSGLLSDLPVTVVTAQSWEAGAAERHEVSAPSIRVISIRGPFDPDGVSVSGDLGVVVSRGAVTNSNWSIGGDVRVLVLDDVSRLTLDVGGDVRLIRADEIRTSEFDIEGETVTLIADSIDGSEMDYGAGLRTMIVRGDVDGTEISANESVGGNQFGFGLRVIRVLGDMTNSSVTFAGLNTATFVGGEMNGVEWGSAQAEGSVFRVNGDVVDSSVTAEADGFRVFNTGSLRGDSSVSSFGALRSAVIRGDLSGDFVVTTVVNVSVLGGMDSALFQTGGLTRMSVQGDVRDSAFEFFVGFLPPGNDVAGFLDIRGSFEDSSIQSQGDLGTLRMWSMVGSSITVGFNGVIDDISGDIGTPFPVGIGLLDVTGFGVSGDAFVDSTVVAATLEDARIASPATENGGEVFGFAVLEIERLSLEFTDRLPVTLEDRTSGVEIFDDLVVRANFDPLPDDGA